MKSLSCQRCERAIPLETLDLKKGRGHCSFCKSTVRFQFQEGLEPEVLRLPVGFSIKRDAEHTQLVIAWFNSNFYGMFGLALFVSIITLVLWNLFDALVLKILFGICLGFALYVFYYAFVVLLNRSKVSVNREQVKVSVGPLPWVGAKSLVANQIKRIGIEQTVRGGSRSRMDFSWIVYAQMTDNQKHTVLDGMDKNGALLVEGEIKRVLGRCAA